jgi:hypothetical protein
MTHQSSRLLLKPSGTLASILRCFDQLNVLMKLTMPMERGLFRFNYLAAPQGFDLRSFYVCYVTLGDAIPGLIPGNIQQTQTLRGYLGFQLSKVSGLHT